MNASALRHEIEVMLGLAGAHAAGLWKLAAAAAKPAASPHFRAFPDFTAPSAPQASKPHIPDPTPPGPHPIPMPYPNFSSATPNTAHGAGGRSSGEYVLTSVPHPASAGQHRDELIECVLAAAAGDAAAARVQPVWTKVRLKLDQLPAPARQALGHEIAHTLQQRGGAA